MFYYRCKHKKSIFTLLKEKFDLLKILCLGIFHHSKFLLTICPIDCQTKFFFLQNRFKHSMCSLTLGAKSSPRPWNIRWGYARVEPIYTLLEMFWRISLYTIRNLMMTLLLSSLCDEIFENFPLFDKTLRHIQLCKASSVKYSEIRQNLSYSAGWMMSNEYS